MHEDLLGAGRAAAARRDWRQAFELLAGEDAARPLDGADLAMYAQVAYAAGHVDATIALWERLHAQSVRAGNRHAAAEAATRVAMHMLFDTALMAPVRGWAARAEGLLQDGDDTGVRAWLAVVHSYERLLSGDIAAAQAWAARAVDVGSRHEPAAAAIGRIAAARCLILEGSVTRGLERLNEAGVAATSGELDDLSTGLVYCELICALQALAQYDLAEQWTEAMERWRPEHALGSMHGRCRVHRAEILRLRGSIRDAEREALLACQELRPYLRREFGWPLTELGRIQLLLGDLSGAEQTFKEAHQAGWNAQPGLALVQLARGDVEQAAVTIREALAHPVRVPSKELPPDTDLSLAPLLDAQVEIAIAAGDAERARWAADRLTQIASRFESKAWHACAARARGQVQLADGDALSASASCEAAVELWSEVGAPHEAALARVGLARAQRALGNHARASLEAQTAGAMFAQLGAVHQAERVADLCGNSPRNPPANVFRRDGDYWSIVFEGRGIHVRHGKGIEYLARLLAARGREIHVLDLVGAVPAGAPLADSHAGELLDAQAKDAYRRRLADIDEDIQRARDLNDVEREAQADAERDFLMRELSRATGLGGRDRRAGSSAERARVSVTRALRSAVVRISEHHPALGAHFDRCIRTGTHCSYTADEESRVVWQEADVR
jgi:tetratricopeptide (TPR) repeat protein